MPDLALINAGELATCSGPTEDAEGQLGVVEEAALLVDRGKVTWVGTTKDFKRRAFGKPRRTIDAGGALVTPGFVDPHTHSVFAGSREDELERKLAGETYASILDSGGGIIRTVRETRGASTDVLVEESLGRLAQLLRNGVTTVEVKTGYGQRLRDELKMLEAIGRLGKASGMDIVATFLGLHATPPEFESRNDYVDYAIREMLPVISRFGVRPSFSDCFCEEGVFSKDQCARYLRASRQLGLSLKIHADEFSDSGGASLAAELECVSADHLGRSGARGIEEMAKRGVVAVLLPGTSLYSRIPYADARRISKAGCKIALGTDLSPNSWIESPQMVMSIACMELKMTPAEALLGFTANAAQAISSPGLGAIRVGCQADFVVHSIPSYKFLPYRVGGHYVDRVFKRGREVFVLRH